jgi:hypothetical protein
MLALLCNHPRQEGDAKTGCGEFDDEIYLTAPAYDGGLETMPSTGIEDDPIQRNPLSNRIKGKFRRAGRFSVRRLANS